MVVYESIIVVNGALAAHTDTDESAALLHARRVAEHLGLAVDPDMDADAVQEVLIDDDRVAYADVAVERRLY